MCFLFRGVGMLLGVGCSSRRISLVVVGLFFVRGREESEDYRVVFKVRG